MIMVSEESHSSPPRSPVFGTIDDDEIPAMPPGSLNVVDDPDLSRRGFAMKKSEFLRKPPVDESAANRRRYLLWMTLFSCISSIIFLLPYVLGYKIDRSDSVLSEALSNENVQKISILCIGISLPLILEQITILDSNQPLLFRLIFYAYYDIPLVWILIDKNVSTMFFVCALLSTINFTFDMVAITIYQLDPKTDVRYIFSVQVFVFFSVIFEFLRMAVSPSLICTIFQHIFYLACILNILYIAILLMKGTHERFFAKAISLKEFLLSEVVSLRFMALLLSMLFLIYAISYLLIQILATQFDSIEDAGVDFIIAFTASRTALIVSLSIMQRYVLSLTLIKSGNEIENKKAFIRYIRYSQDLIEYGLMPCSHELRTPLSILDAGLKLLESRVSSFSGSTAQNENLKAIGVLIQESKLSCRWSLRVMDDLMLFENIIDSSIAVQKKEVVLIPFLQQTAKMYIMHAAMMRIQLQLMQSPESFRYDAYTLFIDEVKMSQAVGNLIYNAINVSPPKTIVRVAVCYICEDESIKTELNGDDKVIGVRIAVSDSGPRLTTSSKSRIFNEDVEFGNKVAVGSGLCLWISKKIVELHDGNIGVYSEAESQGSTFYLDIPLLLTEKEAADSGFSIASLPNSQKPVRSGSALSRGSRSSINVFRRKSSAVVGIDTPSDAERNVLLNHDALVENRTFAKLMKQTSEFFPKPSALRALIVDDSALIRKMMLRILRGMGHSCEEACDGLEAVRMYEKSALNFEVYDVILMEYGFFIF